MKAYIAASEYFSKNIQTFGVGVRASVNPLIARRDAIRKHELALRQYYEIDIPDLTSFLHLDNALSKDSLAPVCTPEALLLVFRREAKALGWQLDTEYRILGERVTEESVQTLHTFYETQKEILLNQKTPAAVLDFFTHRCHDVAITSSFCNRFGIKGITYSDKDGERILIFDPRNEITITNIIRSEEI